MRIIFAQNRYQNTNNFTVRQNTQPRYAISFDTKLFKNKCHILYESQCIKLATYIDIQ